MFETASSNYIPSGESILPSFFSLRFNGPAGVTLVDYFPGALVFEQQKIIGKNLPIGNHYFHFGNGSIPFVIDGYDPPNAIGLFAWFYVGDVFLAGPYPKAVCLGYGEQVEVWVKCPPNLLGVAVGGALDVVHERLGDQLDFRFCCWVLGVCAPC